MRLTEKHLLAHATRSFSTRHGFRNIRWGWFLTKEEEERSAGNAPRGNISNHNFQTFAITPLGRGGSTEEMCSWVRGEKHWGVEGPKDLAARLIFGGWQLFRPIPLAWHLLLSSFLLPISSYTHYQVCLQFYLLSSVVFPFFHFISIIGVNGVNE